MSVRPRTAQRQVSRLRRRDAAEKQVPHQAQITIVDVRSTLRTARADIRRAEQHLLAALPAREREPLRTKLRTLASALEERR